MKTQYLIVCLAVLLILSLGAVIAAGPGNTGVESAQVPGHAVRPILTTAVGPNSVTYWDSGSHGFLREELPPSPGTVLRQISAADITIPAGATAMFVTPLDVPSIVNGAPTSVRNVYLVWNGARGCNITNVKVFTGFFFYDGAGGFNTNFIGTGQVRNVTLNLGGFYPVLNGLSMQWSIKNSATTEKLASIYAYGAQIRY